MGKFDNNMIFRIVLIVLAAFVLIALINYYNSKQNTAKIEKFYDSTIKNANQYEHYNDSAKPYSSPLLVNDEQDGQVSGRGKGQLNGSEEVAQNNEVYRPVDYSSQQLSSDCFPKDRLTAEDLLPKDAANNKFSQMSPAGQGSLSDVNLLSAGYQVGVSTIAGTLRNANLQIRSEPPNPQVSVSPWMQSTISNSDVFRRPLEIGEDCA
jgi:hypothetical protein